MCHLCQVSQFAAFPVQGAVLAMFCVSVVMPQVMKCVICVKFLRSLPSQFKVQFCYVVCICCNATCVHFFLADDSLDCLEKWHCQMSTWPAIFNI